MTSTRTPTPRVSIGLPVRNGEDYLVDAVESLLSQTFTDFELILCDNDSDDATEQICQSFVERDPRVRYERQSANLGAAANYNRTFELATGEYFKWAAHDDVCRPDFLRVCIDELDDVRHSDVAVVYPRSVLIDEVGSVIRDDPDDLALDSEDAAERFAHVIEHVSAANTVFGVFRHDVLAGTALIGPYSASDWMLLAEIALHGKIRQVDDVLFERRIHDDASLRAILLRGGSKREQIAWFDTQRAGVKSLVPFDVLTTWVLLRSVVQAPLAVRDRLRAAAVVPRVYWARLIRFRGGRLKRRLQGRAVDGAATIRPTQNEA